MENVILRHRSYRKGKYALTDAVEYFLQQEEAQRDLNAFVRVYEEEARQRARELDERRSRGEVLAPLAGLTIAIKDNIAYRNHPLTCGSRMLRNFVSPYHATVIQKILAADGLILGSTNMDEFAMGSSSESSCYGPVKNPLDRSRVPGGSSGGSAAAVAAGLCDLALGSETGGSIRQPAAFCGIVGLKPTYGRVSRYGLVAYASSLDQIGPLGRTVADVAYLFGVIAGWDGKDATSARQPVADFTRFLGREVSGLRIGVPAEYFGEGLDPEIRDRVLEVVERLKEFGAEVKQIHLPASEYAIAAYYIIATAEASSNLARYDGVRYGNREPASLLNDMYLKTRSRGFGMEVKRRIMLGTYVLSAGYYEAYYKKAQQVRRLIKQEFDRAFSQVDVLITPTTPTPPFKLGEKIDDPLQMYLCDIYTVTANLTGICGLSVPVGKTAAGLPIGLQILADRFREDLLFRVGDFMEKKLVSGK